MTAHMMGSPGGHLVDPDSLAALDDVVKLTGILVGISSALLLVRKWLGRKIHGRRDRREKLLRDAIAEIRLELAAHSSAVSHQLADIDSKVGDVRDDVAGVVTDVSNVRTDIAEVRKNQIEHVTDHATGKFRTA